MIVDAASLGSLECTAPPTFAVDICTELAAEHIRVFQALTIAEYVETWSASSRRNEVICRTELRPGGDYRISIGQRGRSVFDLRGEFIAYEPFSTIVCSLEHSAFPQSPSSLVILRLDQSAGVTLLAVTHTGIATAGEAAYFRRMWTGCLGRLAKLFAPYRAVDEVLRADES